MKTYLFIGGPIDGQVRGVDHDQKMIGIPEPLKELAAAFDPTAPVPSREARKTHVYSQMHFSGVLRKVTVYAHEKLNPDDVLDAFIGNYRPAKSSR